MKNVQKVTEKAMERAISLIRSVFSKKRHSPYRQKTPDI